MLQLGHESLIIKFKQINNHPILFPASFFNNQKVENFINRCIYIYFFPDDDDEEEAPAPKAKAKAVKQAKKEESDDEEDDEEDDDEESSEGIWSLSKITSTQYISLCPAEVFNF